MTQEPETPETVTPEAEIPEATEATEEPAVIEPAPTFGFNDYAEKINGRFAMLGFLILIVLELLTRQDIFTWLGLR